MAESTRGQAMSLTVLIAMYNSCENVAETLEKLAEQKTNHSLEVILINDGSGEDASEVENICNRYNFIYKYQRNAGEATTRDNGLKMATGDYVTWVDADDSITDDYLDVIFSEIEDGAYDFITHPWKYTDGTAGCRHEPPLVNWNVWSNVYRTSKVQDVPFDKDMRIASDTEWLKRAITSDMVWLDSDRAINIYNAENPDSLTNQFARGEIKVRFSDDR